MVAVSTTRTRSAAKERTKFKRQLSQREQYVLDVLPVNVDLSVAQVSAKAALPPSDVKRALEKLVQVKKVEKLSPPMHLSRPRFRRRAAA